jgi:hypothetical protein
VGRVPDTGVCELDGRALSGPGAGRGDGEGELPDGGGGVWGREAALSERVPSGDPVSGGRGVLSPASAGAGVAGDCCSGGMSGALSVT